MIKPIFYTFIFISCLTKTYAQTIDIQSLGQFNKEYQNVESLSHIPGRSLVANVEIMPGHSYHLKTPADINQLTFLLSDGDKIVKGQAFAKLSGSEVHHFMTRLDAKKQLFEIAKKRRDNSKVLVRKKIIDEDKWLQINNNYYSSLLEYEHLLHFAELIEGKMQDETITITAPTDGYFVKPKSNNYFEEEDTLASFVSAEQIKLKVNLPITNSSNVAFLELLNCKLNITTHNKTSSGAFVEVWSESIKSECQLMLGQQVSVKPYFQQKAYRLNKQAVFSLEGDDHILVRQGEVLKLVKISLLASVADDYIFSSGEVLTNASVLVSSVSAVQGLLIGLGGE